MNNDMTMALYLHEMQTEMEAQDITSTPMEFLELATTFHAIIESNYYADVSPLDTCKRILNIMADEIVRISSDVSV